MKRESVPFNALCITAAALLITCAGAFARYASAKAAPQKQTRQLPTKKATPKKGAPTVKAASRNNKSAVVKNSIGMEFVYVPAGSFMMGSTAREIDIELIDEDEGPQHRVTIREGFYMGQYEVSIAEWSAVMGDIPEGMKDLDGKFKESKRQPVVSVSWNDAQDFIKKLNARGDGYTYRLPTEAEWEYACRAGTTTPFAFGSSLSSDQANFDGDYPDGGASKGVYRQKTTPVGSFPPNAWGLYDMHGNVWEWCEDVWHDSYNGAPIDGSAWLRGGMQEGRVMRGGSWDDFSSGVRSARRGSVASDQRDNLIGFRVVALARR